MNKENNSKNKKTKPLQDILRAEELLTILESRAFHDFYKENGDFDNYIRVDYPTSHPLHINKEEILEQIKKLFRTVL